MPQTWHRPQWAVRVADLTATVSSEIKMFRIGTFVTGAFLGLAMLAGPAVAQNFNLNPSYGSVRLNAGFMPDPYVVRVRAGGDNYFQGGGGCPGGGWFANAPDFRVFYQAGGYQFSIYARAGGDTMLLVNDPNGNWFCNDDYSGLDPAVVFDRPRSGRYEIWAGTYNRSRVQNTRIHITELGPFNR
jgi:hypothetical protein